MIKAALPVAISLLFLPALSHHAQSSSDFIDVLPAYPDSGMLNVRDFGAKGDGVHDDLPAIKAALNQALKDNGRYSRPPFIYFPAGTYLVGDTLEGRIDDKWSNGWRSSVMLMGEQRDLVTIKIPDNHPNFQDPSKPNPVIKTGSEDPRPHGGGNRAFRHNIFNLTVDTGKGNPGANGIDYVSSNRGAIRNVTIRSGDASGAGVTGLAMNREWPGPALVKNVVIEGFDVGVQTKHHGQYSMTLSNVTLRGQKKLGIENDENGLFIENLLSENSVPVIQQNRRSGLIVVQSGRFTGGNGGPAILNEGGMILRDISVDGYAHAVDNKVKDHETKLPAGKIEEWISGQTIGSGNAKGLGLPVKPSPEFVSKDPAEWQNAAEFFVEGAEDQTAAIQKALNSGKPVVYFPNGGYNIRETLIVPPSVRKITGLQSAISPSDNFQGTHLLKVVGSGEPLVIEHLWFSKGTKEGEPSSNNKVVVQDSSRSVVFRHADIHGGYENTAKGTGDVFIEDTMGTPIRIKHPQSVWGRQVNCEFLDGEPMVSSNGGNVWILGYKTEGQQTIFAGKGGKVEILGGLAYALGKENQKYDRLPMFTLDGTRATISIAGNGNEWTTVIKDRGKEWKSSDFPKRGRASMLLFFSN